jgi:hypothetical protein
MVENGYSRLLSHQIERQQPTRPGSQPPRRSNQEMAINLFPIGLEMDVSYPNFKVNLTLLSAE